MVNMPMYSTHHSGIGSILWVHSYCTVLLRVDIGAPIHQNIFLCHCIIITQSILCIYLSSPFEIGQLLLKDDEAERKESHDQAVTSITKHHSKQEWERDDSVWGCR